MTEHCPPEPTPSPGYHIGDHAKVRGADLRLVWADLSTRMARIEERITAMGAREDAADARQLELIGLVRDHLAAKDARIAELEAALVAADADKAAALEADSEADADRQEAVNAALEELAGVHAEEPPADESGDDAASEG